jgi:putative nucleotidyltransferase with HDIG domain
MINTHVQPAPNEKALAHLQAIIHQLDKEEGRNGHKEMRQEVLSRLNRVEALPTLPSIAAHIFKIASDPDSSAQELTRLIENDPPLTSKLLKIVNSAFYGFPQKIGTVKQAVVILGTDEIMDLSFGLAAAKVFDLKAPNENMNPKALWRHSMGTALISQKLCQEMPKCERLGGFTAGLLHDFGKIFILEHFAETYEKVFSEYENDHIPFFELEEKWFGLNHAKVGEFLASHWNLPKSLVEAISHHHQPFFAPDDSELAALVGLADCLYHRVETARQADNESTPALPPLLTVGHTEVLTESFKGLGKDSIEKMTEDAQAILEQSAHLFALLD